MLRHVSTSVQVGSLVFDLLSDWPLVMLETVVSSGAPFDACIMSSIRAKQQGIR